MALRSLTIHWDHTGDREMFHRSAARLNDLSDFLKTTGAYVMSSALRRLPQVLSMGADVVRTGRLSASLAAADKGGGSEHTIWWQGLTSVEVGSNLPYAAHVHYGGTIVARPPRKYLAIPRKRSLRLGGGIMPRHLDPAKEVLRFVPAKPGGKAVGYLVDDKGTLGHGTGVLYVLVPSVTHRPRPYLFMDAEDRRTIFEELWPTFMGLKD